MIRTLSVLAAAAALTLAASPAGADEIGDKARPADVVQVEVDVRLECEFGHERTTTYVTTTGWVLAAGAWVPGESVTVSADTFAPADPADCAPDAEPAPPAEPAVPAEPAPVEPAPVEPAPVDEPAAPAEAPAPLPVDVPAATAQVELAETGTPEVLAAAGAALLAIAGGLLCTRARRN